ncbi:hypothetical protein HGB13_01965 [bacterium]|nr:hypothetical protein [bacterium]
MRETLGWPPNIDKSADEQFWEFIKDPDEFIKNNGKNIEAFVRNRCFILKDAMLVPRDTMEPFGFRDAIDFCFFMNFPFCSYNIWPLDDGIFEDIWFNSPAIRRLTGIKQLSYLTGFVYDDEIQQEVIDISYMTTGYTAFTHTRAEHSLLVSLLMSLMLDGFGRYDYINGVLAGAFHDIATPAGGEATAGVSDEFDEEENFKEVFYLFEDEEKWKDKYPEFDIEYISRIIKNEGLVGKILDMCDKLAYVILDVYHYANTSPNNFIRRFAKRYPLFGDIIWNLKIDREREIVYFDDPSALFYFLEVRAYEFEDLLKRPSRKLNEWYVRSIVKKLLKAKKITRHDLLTKDDEFINYAILEYYGELLNCLWNKEDFLKAVICNPEEVDTTISNCLGKGWQLMGQERIRGFKPDTDILVKDSKGNIVPFRQAEKQKAAHIEAIAQDTGTIALYFRTHTPQETTFIDID